MPVVAFLIFVAVVVWAIALARFKVPGADQLSKLSPLHLGGVMVLIVGSVFGYEFFHISGGPIPITLDRLLLGCLVVLAGWAWLMNKENMRRPNGMDVSVFGVIGILCLSTFIHDFGFAKNLPLSRFLFFYCLPLALYLIVRTAKLNSLDLAAITTALGALAVYLAITGIAEVKNFHAIVFPRYIVESTITEFFGRGRGPFLNPVSNGVFQIAGFCCIWFWWPKGSRRVRMLVVVSSLLVAVGVYATLTRSVWMALILVVGVGFWVTTSRQQKGILIVLGTLAAIVLIPAVGDKVFSFKRDKNVTLAQMSKSAQLRPLFLTVALRMFEDRPLFGCGFGQYAREKTPYLQDSTSSQPLRQTKVYLQHNVFLAYLTEMGLAGLFVLLIMLGVMARSAWLLWINRKQTLEQRQFGLLLAAMLVCFCVNGMFHDTSIMPMMNYLLFFVAGIVNNIRTAPTAVVETVATTAPTRPLPARGFPATN